jgi:ketosteroid isomerase-like protein
MVGIPTALLGGAMLVAGLAVMPGAASGAGENAALAAQVHETEAAFARSMAERDFAAFTALVSDEAIFFSAHGVLRGKAAVAAAWKAYFDAPQAPFSWRPESVEVLDSGTLAHSSGPVFAPDGHRIATFNSIWRREADGRWRIVFDKGYPWRE